MKRNIATSLITICVVFLCFDSPSASVLTVERGSDLQSVIDYARDGDTLLLGTKTFSARRTPFVDSLCGNCDDPLTPHTATYGFIIQNKSLVLLGKDRAQTRLITNAGYGLLIVNAPSVSIHNLTITGGKRDAEEMATCAAVVVRNSQVHLNNVDIIDNNHMDSSIVVGIGGIFGREGAELLIENCRIMNTSWDGIALYRGASATVIDCVIQDGRGVGIGITWDATCLAYRNEVSGFWKGIGAFGTSWVAARNNLVHNNLGWGIIATGESCMDIANNVVHHNGNCGIAPWSTASRGRIVNNIITDNGWREEWVCPCVGIWNYGDWAKWHFSNNIVWENKNGEYEDIWDQTGFNGNLNVDPKFAGEDDFRLQPDSPGIHTGDSTVFNLDGTISHIGLYGGPQSWRMPTLNK